MTAAELLKMTRDRLSDKDNWCQGAHKTTDDYPAKQQYCIVATAGMIHRTQAVMDIMVLDKVFNLLGEASEALYGKPVITVNDLMGYEAVMKVLDLAIQRS